MYVPIGAAVGFLSGLLVCTSRLRARQCYVSLPSGSYVDVQGVGGGLVMIPLLAAATEMPQQAIIGTSLVAMIPTSIVGLYSHYRLGNVVKGSEHSFPAVTLVLRY